MFLKLLPYPGSIQCLNSRTCLKVGSTLPACAVQHRLLPAGEPPLLRLIRPLGAVCLLLSQAAAALQTAPGVCPQRM